MGTQCFLHNRIFHNFTETHQFSCIIHLFRTDPRRITKYICLLSGSTFYYFVANLKIHKPASNTHLKQTFEACPSKLCFQALRVDYRVNRVWFSKLQKHTLSTLSVSQSYQIPRASGQSLAIPAAVSRGDTGLSNRKCS